MSERISVHIGGFGSRLFSPYWVRMGQEFGIDPATGLLSLDSENQRRSIDEIHDPTVAVNVRDMRQIHKYFYET